jgi:hypothetical protein
MNIPILRGMAFMVLWVLILTTSGSAVSRETDPVPNKSEISSKIPIKSTASPKDTSFSETGIPAATGSSPASTAVLPTPTTTYSLSGEQTGWQVLSMGGRSGSSASFRLQGTIGQLAVGSGTAADNVLNQGFWQGLGAPLGCCGLYTGGLTGNTDCDLEGLRDLADVTRLIDRIYLSMTNSPLCCEENGNTDGDPEGNLNLVDITRLIDLIFVSHRETAACN